MPSVNVRVQGLIESLYLIRCEVESQLIERLGWTGTGANMEKMRRERILFQTSEADLCLQ